jgi:flagellar protein FliO/FliZ
MKSSPAHITYAVAASLTTLVLTSPAFAASAEERTPLNLESAEEPAKAAATGGGGGGIARMVVGLAVVIGVIYGLAWVLRQVKASKEGSATGGGLSSVSSLPLGPNRSVHLVRAGHDLVLLGAAEKGITPIRTYTEAEARAAGLLGDEDQLALAAAGNGNGNGSSNGSPIAFNVVEALRKRTVRK